MTICKQIVRPGDVDPSSMRLEITTRISWMVNNATPDSIIMNMMCRSLVPPVEPNVRSTEVVLTSKNTLRILNTIKPVTRAFMAMDTAKHVRISLVAQRTLKDSPYSKWVASVNRKPSDAIQEARDDNLKSAYKMKINRLTYECDC